MRATAEPIEGSRVRLSVEVDAGEVDRALDETVRKLTRQTRVPGFRPGKVPRRVLEARMGGPMALRGEALREALPDFYARAVADAAVDPIAPPEIDITAGEESGALSFDAVVQVRPIVAIPGYAGLQVTVPTAMVTDEDVDSQLDRLREQEGELLAVDRPAIDKDNVTINIHGTAPNGEEVLAADDLLYEVGSGSIVAELDAQLRGAKVGDVLAFDASTAGAQQQQGSPATVAIRVLVKQVQEKRLPELTDAWAADSSEFPTVIELRADLRDRLQRVKLLQTQFALRENGLAALVDLVEDDEVPEVLVDSELRERLHDLGHRLEEQQLTFEQLLAATGRSADELVAELRGEAARSVKADLALRALASAEGIEVSDEELVAEIASISERMNVDPEVVRRQLDHEGRTAAVRSERRKTKALAWLIDHVELVDSEGNPVSRDDLRVDQGEETPDTGAETTEGTE